MWGMNYDTRMQLACQTPNIFSILFSQWFSEWLSTPKCIAKQVNMNDFKRVETYNISVKTSHFYQMLIV